MLQKKTSRDVVHTTTKLVTKKTRTTTKNIKKIVET